MNAYPLRRVDASSLLVGWRKAMEAGATTGLAAEELLVPASEVKVLKAQIRELERLLGRYCF